MLHLRRFEPPGQRGRQLKPGPSGGLVELTVVKFSKGLRTCSAQTANEILVVFSTPPELAVSVGDKLIVPEFRMDAEVELLHDRSGASFRVFIRSQDVHDLRVPAAHGTSRTPTPERIDTA